MVVINHLLTGMILQVGKMTDHTPHWTPQKFMDSKSLVQPERMPRGRIDNLDGVPFVSQYYVTWTEENWAGLTWICEKLVDFFSGFETMVNHYVSSPFGEYFWMLSNHPRSKSKWVSGERTQNFDDITFFFRWVYNGGSTHPGMT